MNPTNDMIVDKNQITNYRPEVPYILMRRNSMTKLEIVEKLDFGDGDPLKKKVSANPSDSSAIQSQNSSTSLPSSYSMLRPILKQKNEQKIVVISPAAKKSIGHYSVPTPCHSQHPMPSCLSESAVAKEKPSLRTRLLVCVLSGATIVFCWLKLFIWK